MPVCKATITVTVLMAAKSPDEAGARLMSMPLESIVHEMGEGAFVGSHKLTAIEQVEPKNVRAELQAVGNDGAFFEDIDSE